MGLGKTVMTIALILARPGRKGSNDIEITKKRKIDSDTTTPSKPKGGTLVVCPLSLLSQWKVNSFLFVSHPLISIALVVLYKFMMQFYKNFLISSVYSHILLRIR